MAIVSDSGELETPNSSGTNLGVRRGSQMPGNSASKLVYMGKRSQRLEESAKILPVYFPTSLYYLKYTRLRQ